MKFSLHERASLWESLKKNPPDVVIVGGGVVGASAAAHLGFLGVSCVLFEKGDFGSGTSGASTGLAHAGLRYLAQGDVGYVLREAKERLRLEGLVPHLFKVFPFIFPVYKGSGWPFPLVKLGTRIYDLLYRVASSSLDRPDGRHFRFLKAEEILKEVHGLAAAKLKGGTQYYVDGELKDSRLALAFAQTAYSFGVRTLNYAEVTRLIIDETGLKRVVCQSRLDQQVLDIPCKLLLNCSGPDIDARLKDWGVSEGKPTLLRSRGTHLLIDRIASTPLIFSASDQGRVFFVLPYGNRRSLVGTTDVALPDGQPDTGPAPDELKSLVRQLFSYFPALSKETPKGKDPVAHFITKKVSQIYWGVRPLARQGGPSSSASRDHTIVFSSTSGIWSVPGAKLTAARAVGEEVARHAFELIRQQESEPITLSPLPGGEMTSVEELISQLRHVEPTFSDEEFMYFVGTYGNLALKVFRLFQKTPDLKKRVLPHEPWVFAEVVYAARFEMVLRLNDFLWRRSRWARYETLPPEVVKKIAHILGEELGWTAHQVHQEIADYEAVFSKTQLHRALVK